MTELSSALAMLGESALAAARTDAILACNEATAAHGLSLTLTQALSLEETRRTSLKRTGRIEFGGGITEKLIRAFCGSPYISQQVWEKTLHTLTELFYDLKNELPDSFSDDRLISAMLDAFDGPCRGETELLSGEMTELIRRENRSRAGEAEHE